MAETLIVRPIIKQGGQEMVPAIPDMTVSNCITNIPNKVIIPASSVDFPVKLDTNANADKRVIVLMTNSANGNKLRCKVESSTKVDYIAPFQVYSEDLDTILVTNTDTTNDLILWVFYSNKESA